MTPVIFYVLIAAALAVAMHDLYKMGEYKGYDEGMTDSIEIFQEYLKEEEETINGKETNAGN